MAPACPANPRPPPTPDITAGTVDRAVHGRIADACSRSTVKNTLAALAGVLEQAVRDGILTLNPARVSGWQSEYQRAEDEASPTPNVTTGYGTEPKALQTPGGPVAPGLGCQAPTSPPSRCAAGTPGRSRPGRGRPATLHRLAVRGVPPRVYALFRPWRREPSVSGSCALGRPCGPPPSRVPARPCGIPSAGGPPGYPGPGTRRCRSSPCPAPAGASLP